MKILHKDYEIYKLSHSLILWTIILIITKLLQAVYASDNSINNGYIFT